MKFSSTQSLSDQRQIHWSEYIFGTADDLPPSTRFPGAPKPSVCFGPSTSAASLPSSSTTLFHLPFHQSSLHLYCLSMPDSPASTRFFVSYKDPITNLSRYSQQDLHHLCLRRRKRGIDLARRSQSEDRNKAWLELRWKSWEQVVLFQAVFLALKANHPRISTRNMDADDFEVRRREERLFQGYAIFFPPRTLLTLAKL